MASYRQKTLLSFLFQSNHFRDVWYVGYGGKRDRVSGGEGG